MCGVTLLKRIGTVKSLWMPSHEMSVLMHVLLHHRQQRRSYLVLGVGAWDAYVITLLKSRRLIHHVYYLSQPPMEAESTNQLGVHGHQFGGNPMLETVEQDWKEYFADPLKWWDKRFSKMSPQSPDFEHKVTMKALWVDGCSTPPWVKAMVKLVSLRKLPCGGGHHELNRLSKGNFGKRSTLPTSAKTSKQAGQARSGSSRMLSATTACEAYDGGSSSLRSASTNASAAIDVFKSQLQQGIAIDSYSYVEILKRCLKQEDLPAVKQVHEYATQSGMQQNIYVANSLLSGYIRCGRLEDARRVFDELAKKSVVTWSVMIGGLAQHGCGSEAYRLLVQMKREGFKANAITYLSILNECASAVALEWVRDVHSHVREAGFESDVRVGTALVHMYAKCGSIDDARLAFDKMEERNVITWNVMIGGLAQHGCGSEAYRLLLRMKQEGLKPDGFTYASILNARASAGALEWVRDVHSHIREAGFESDVRVGNALVHMYAKCGSIDHARLAFDKMEERSVITWSVMIGGLAQHGCGSEAYRLLLRMKREGFRANAITYLSILNGCASAGALGWVRDVHSHVREAGFESDVRVGNALVHMYAKCGSIDDARLAFDKMEERDVITWNVLIGGLAQHGCGSEAYRLLLEMKREGFKPNAITYLSILNGCASAGALEWVREVHSHVREAGFETDVRVGNALVHMYAKCGSIDDARLAFDKMEERDVITWNVMIGGLAEHGYGREALDVFKTMIADGVKPNEISFVAVLSACSHSGLVDEGRRLFSAMTQDYGIEASVELCTCMVDVLGRAGHLEEAKLLIGNMLVEPGVATWGALLGACRTYGSVELGKLAANELLKLEPNDASAYVVLSNMYAAAGKWEEVSSVRTMMQERGIRKEPGRSWIEVDNKVHYFVVGDTSHSDVREIYAELRRLSEAIKAQGYIPDIRLVLQNIEEEEKELALCLHSEKLAIVYGLMRTTIGQPIRVFKNLRVCSDCHTATKFISKVAKRDIVVRDANRFHHFQDGVCSCGDYW